MKPSIFLTSLAVMLLAGCDNKQATQSMPEVNEENCHIDIVRKIEDKAMRETFAGLCSRRSHTGGIPPAGKPMNWLELTDPKGHGAKP